MKQSAFPVSCREGEKSSYRVPQEWHGACGATAVTSDKETLLLRKSMHGLYIGALMFLTVILVGTTSYWLQHWRIGDAFYMVILVVLLRQ